MLSHGQYLSLQMQLEKNRIKFFGHGIVPLGVPYNLHFAKLTSAYKKSVKGADVI